MNDVNWKTWGLILVVALGITLEAVKRMPGAGVKLTADALKFPGPEMSPYQVKFGGKNPPDMLPPMRMPIAKGTHVAGQGAVNRETIEKFIAANSARKGEFNHIEKGAEGKDLKAKVKKKKDDAEYEIIIDPRTGKRYRRKKKKIAKVEEVKVEVAKEEPKKEEPKKVEDVDALLNQAIAGGGLPPVTDKADSPHADFEEWKRRLLSYPDAAETRRFIEHYKNGIVTAEIFYKITALMLDDSRPTMKELGVLCAGLTPSVLSFQVLNDVVNKERSGSSLRKYSESFLNQYATLSNLYVIERILKSPASGSIAIQASKKLDTAANTYLAPAQNKVPKGASASSMTTHSNAPYFKRFVTPLTALSKNADAQVSEQARNSLANLNKLMNLGTSAPETLVPSTTTTTAPAQASTQPL